MGGLSVLFFKITFLAINNFSQRSTEFWKENTTFTKYQSNAERYIFIITVSIPFLFENFVKYCPKIILSF